MDEKLAEVIRILKELSAEKWTDAINQNTTSHTWSEWDFGYSMGLDFAIELIERTVKE